MRNLFLSIFILFIVLISSVLKAQIVDNFNTEKPIKDKFKLNFELADGYIFDDNYKEALPLLLELNKLDVSNRNIKFLLGLTYLQMPMQKQFAIPYFSQVIDSMTQTYIEGDPWQRFAPETALKYLAEAYRINYDFDSAIVYFNKYNSLLDYKNQLQLEEIEEVSQKILWCENAKKLVRNPVKIIVTNLGSKINTIYPEYSPVLSADEETMVFTSRREGSTGLEFTNDGNYFEDIYLTKKNKDGTWEYPRKIPGQINTEGHEATLGLSADGTTLLIYKDDNADGNIYSSKLEGEYWSLPEKLGSDINTKAWETSASLNVDGSIIYFTSNREGGFGGRDIYSCKKLPNGEWAAAQRLSDEINTPYEEEAPFIHPDGRTLFFSSQGHFSMGGFDIFMSQLQDDGSWSAPINLGYPINTPGDDLFYQPSLDGLRAYYASFNPGGYGEKDIYMLTLPKSSIVPLTIVKGLFKYAKIPQIPKNCNVTVNDEMGQLIGYYKSNDSNGKYLMVLEQGKEYNLTFEAEESKYVFSQSLFVPVDTSSEGNNIVELITELDSEKGVVNLRRVGFPVAEEGKKKISLDYDNDGIADNVDIDDDNDGIIDVIEGLGVNPSGDDNQDGVLNYYDRTYVHSTEGKFIDKNGDGVNDIFDKDGDGIPNHLDLDSDNDGLMDIIEVGKVDIDGDGVIDSKIDVNKDGWPDAVDPAYKGIPIVLFNQDKDKWPDFLDIDSDGDGIVDNLEAQKTKEYIPITYEDKDYDGVYDSYDLNMSGITLKPVDTDNDKIPDYRDEDSDNDGIVDAIEGHDFNHDGVADMQPIGKDLDNDGLDDGYDLMSNSESANSVNSLASLQNTDGTDELDFRDTDDDNDGVLTKNEKKGGLNYLDAVVDFAPKYSTENRILLEYIFFEFDRYDITYSESVKLKKLVEIMKLYPDLKIGLSGYTDSKGSHDYNLNLANKRAFNTIRFLMDLGIEKERFQINFYGETNPIATNETESGKDNPLGRKLNRRVELFVLNPEAAPNFKIEPPKIPTDLKIK